MIALELLLSILNNRNRSRARYANSLAVYAHPVLPATLQQYFPLTQRHALILSSGRNDVTAQNIAVQLEPQQLTPLVTNIVENVLLDTFQGVGTLQSHVGESNFTWANNNGGIDYDTAYGVPVQITANGVQVPGVLPGAPTLDLFTSLDDGTPIYTLDGNNQVTVAIGWNLLADHQFDLIQRLADAGGINSNSIQIHAANQGIQTLLECTVTIGGVPTTSSVTLTTADSVGAHELAAIVDNAGITLFLDTVQIDTVAADFSALPPLGYYSAAAKNNSFVAGNVFVTELGVVPSGSSYVIDNYQFLRGIETSRLKPELMLDFKVPPINPISVIAQQSTTPASILQTILNLTQGF